MIRDEAEKIAASVNVGFDPISLITILLPMLMQMPCFKQEQVSAKEFLQDHYDDTTGRFDQILYDRARPKARRAARKDGRRGLSSEQLDEITHASLVHAMGADESTVVACFAEGSTIQDDTV
jgi:hypothetical protein